MSDTKTEKPDKDATVEVVKDDTTNIESTKGRTFDEIHGKSPAEVAEEQRQKAQAEQDKAAKEAESESAETSGKGAKAVKAEL